MSAAPRTLLLVEDDPRVADFVARGLRAEGWGVVHVADGRQGFEQAKRPDYAVIVLDVMLPGLTGFEIAQGLRAEGVRTPILMLTALDAVEDRVEGLRLGADDYLGKPFAFDELVARVAALARRSGVVAAAPKLVVGDIAFDRDSLIASRAGRPLDLTAKELALLEFLMTQAGRVVSRERILSHVWGVSEDPLTNVVDVFIRRLRKKLGDPDARVIRTVRGYGYRLDAPGSDGA